MPNAHTKYTKISTIRKFPAIRYRVSLALHGGTVAFTTNCSVQCTPKWLLYTFMRTTSHENALHMNNHAHMKVSTEATKTCCILGDFANV